MTDQELASRILEGGRLRALLLELWQRTRIDWGFVTDRLSTAFRKESWVGGHERRFVSETLFGMVRHLRRIDLGLERGRKVKKSPRDLERLIALLVLEQLVTTAQATRAEPGIDWNAVIGVDDAIAKDKRLVTRIAFAHSLPDWLAAMLVADHGDSAEGLARALNERAPMVVRANLLVTNRAELEATLAKEGISTHPGRWSDTALIVESRTNLFATDAFQKGALEVQDEGSQLLADLAVAAKPDAKKIVDLCAGAGGKTLAMAARLNNRGSIIASDVDHHKLGELKRRARRATVSNTRAIELGNDGRWPAELDALRGMCDLVLVDAPCSGIGALRRNPEARWRLRPEDLAELAKRQRAILENAVELAAPGGRVVYATCTLTSVENRGVVAGFSLVPIRDIWGSRAETLGDGEVLVVRPDRHGTDGFFAAVIQK